MSEERYHRSAKEGPPYPLVGREVLFWEEHDRSAASFLCPCTKRSVYIIDPPHGISFDEDGYLIVKGSMGSKADPVMERPANWCHFFIGREAPGEVEICEDAQCPGACA